MARLAGVSLATASRVLGPAGTRRVGSELRHRVEKAARQLGYTPNLVARTLAHGASDVVGLIVHDLTDPYFAMLAGGVMRAAERRGLVVLISATRRDPEREIAHVATLRAQRARAIVLAGTRVTDDRLTGRLAAELERYRAAGGRAACVGRTVLPADTVVPDNHGGAARLARSLAALGHRRFAVLAGPPELMVVRERLAGFAEGLRDAGLPDPQVLYGDFDRDGGHALAERLLAEGTDATCVFAANDVMAVGALAALRARGVSVPADLSLAGFDDIPTSRDTVPALTTVRLPLEDMGERVLDLALDPDSAGEWRAERIPAEVIIRESTRDLR
ncbi:LacI family DNA-binding transcriptional regulator [Thermopolyspora sp. NPDC052614]|uniref:LacI family DNA-binding transcriptional regulator n=1 Tax=Thermopolyspora sp. NPDC052614 TaxID=3155682 RepID=UPI003415D62C